ncbi:MAG TPA: cytochrome c [Usitatibacter sp.]|nr:cytochrome c [Usitatibacter sp.]
MNILRLRLCLACALATGAGMLFSCGEALAADSDSDAAGSKLFHTQDCTGCHGPNGEGIPGLAPSLKGDKFVMSASEADIAHVIKQGRAGSEKLYKDLSQPMPPHPNLDDQQLKQLVEYLKNGLQKR